MIKVALCDDNPIILREYGNLIDRLAKKHSHEIELSTYLSGEALLEAQVKGIEDAQIIYLDILMDRTNGIQTAQKLRELKCKAEIIFLTANESFVFQAFNVLPFHYLVKNIYEVDKFEQVWLRAVHKVKESAKAFYVMENSSVSQKKPLSSLIYFQVKNRTTCAFLEDEVISFCQSLDQVAWDLKGMGFLRTHRSYLVNAEFISRIEKKHVILSTGETIPLSKGHYQEVKQAYSDYLIAQLR